MSASARSAVANPSRTSMPDDRFFSLASRKRSSSANAIASFTRRAISFRGYPSTAP